MSNPKTTRSKWLPAASLLIVLAGLWLPRSFQLDHFVTSDESRWLIRSGNFLHALSTGELEQTFQHGHPGVTIMWLGALGYQWAYPEYPAETPGQFGWKDDLYEAFIEGQGRDPLDLLAAGRWMVALANVVVLGLAFLVWRRLVGLWAGGLGLLLIAFDPFEMAFARFLHPDGLLYALMMLSVVGCLGFCLGASNSEGKRHARSGSREGFDARYGWLLLSGVAAGLAWLTKTPGLFLIPFCGLLLLIRGLVDAGRDGSVQSIGAHFQPLIVAVAKSFGGWLLVAVVIFVGCWPAMWVAPIETLAKVFDISAGYATGGHDNPIFFRGETFFGDPGMVFYPVTVIWRASPIVLLGLALGLVWVVASGLQTFQGKMDRTGDGISGSRFRNSAAFGALIGFVLLFGLFMNLGAKKFDRYLLPIYPMLALAAGLGWAGIGSWISAVIGRVRGRSVASRPALVALGICLIAGQAAISLPHFPYYISYYNPSIGGGEAAKSTLAIGWGEGMDEAARYLEQEATAEAEGGAGALTVASWHQRSPFGYFFDGSSIPLEFFWTADYPRSMPANSSGSYRPDSSAASLLARSRRNASRLAAPSMSRSTRWMSWPLRLGIRGRMAGSPFSSWSRIRSSRALFSQAPSRS